MQTTNHQDNDMISHRTSTAKTTTKTYRVTYRNVWDNRRYPFISGVTQEQAGACFNRKMVPVSDFCMESDWRVEAD